MFIKGLGLNQNLRVSSVVKHPVYALLTINGSPPWDLPGKRVFVSRELSVQEQEPLLKTTVLIGSNFEDFFAWPF